MSWTTPAELRAQAQRLWARGDTLRALVTPEASRFPHRLRLTRPSRDELDARYAEAREWIAALRKLVEIRLDWRETRHAVLGRNAVPVAAWLDTPQAAARRAGEAPAFARFEALHALTMQRAPRLATWVARKPLEVLAVADDWGRLIDVAEWLLVPRETPIYLRQIDVPGVHTKFIEQHRAMLTGMLESLRRPADDTSAAQASRARGSSARAFASANGLRVPPEQVRFRLLDDAMELLPGIRAGDVTLEAETFARLRLGVDTGFVTENLVNFLAFPPSVRALAVFGSGYGFAALAQARWLQGVELVYWGDLDTTALRFSISFARTSPLHARC